MSLDSILGTAASGLASINQQLAIVSQNVANAGTAGYARETAAETSLTAGGSGYGVRTGPATQAVDAALQQAASNEDAAVAGAQVRSDALAAMDAAQGATGSGDDLPTRLGALRDSFTALDADPANQTWQSATITAARTLADGIQRQAVAYSGQRQAAQDGILPDVAALNNAVAAIGGLSKQIIALKVQGVSTADLEAQRTAQEQTASQLGGLQFLAAANGDVTAIAGGSIVDTAAASGPFSIAPATLGNGAAAPPLLLSGVPVTGQVIGGSVGARLALRDTDLPQAQAGLDEFAKTLATRLDDQGLRLFTDPAGNPPALGGTPVQSGYAGFSSVITLNPAVAANPMTVRDGTGSVTAGTGGASAFTPNPPGGPEGDTTLIGRILTYAFGAEAQAGTPQPSPALTGLGAAGTIALPYQPGRTLVDFAANLAGYQAQTANSAQEALTTGQALQSTLQTKLASNTGVSVDTELSNMVELQNAYGANAKIITAAQSMWAALLASVNA